jgi:selenocysteine-specific translation elongation factor
VESDILDATMDPKADTNSDSEVENLIKQVQAKMNTMSDEQLDFTNKAIAGRDVQKLKAILSKMAK